MKTRATQLLGIEHPILQGGMAWISDYHLAAALSNAGAAGIIATGGRDAADSQGESTDGASPSNRVYRIDDSAILPSLKTELGQWTSIQTTSNQTTSKEKVNG